MDKLNLQLQSLLYERQNLIKEITVTRDFTFAIV